MNVRRSIVRIAAFTFFALTFLGWWQNTLAAEYAGPLVWNLIMAGLFWLATAATVLEAVRLAREALQRVLHRSPLR
jgi:formate hydrogenlyase subunit 4